MTAVPIQIKISYGIWGAPLINAQLIQIGHSKDIIIRAVPEDQEIVNAIFRDAQKLKAGVNTK